MKRLLITFSVMLVLIHPMIACKPSKKMKAAKQYRTDSLKMERAIRNTMKDIKH